MRYLFFVFCFAIAFANCKSDKGKEQQTGVKIYETRVGEQAISIAIDPDKATGGKASDIIDAESIEFIPLETTEASLVGSIRLMKWYDGVCYIHDDTQQVIQVFSDKGKHLRSLSRLGRGPHEYTEINDFVVEKDSLIVLDFAQLLYYNKNDFSYIKTKPLGPLGIGAFSLHVDKNYFYFHSSDVKAIKANVILTDKNLEVKSALLSIDYPYMTATPYPFVTFGEQVFYYKYMNDTLYQVTEKGLIASYFFDGGKDMVNLIEYQKLPIIEGMIGRIRQLPPKGFMPPFPVFFIDSTFAFRFGQKGRQGLYSLRSGEIRVFASEKVIRDIPDIGYLVGRISDGEYAYNYVSPDELRRMNGGKEYRSPVLKNIKEDDNPIVIKFKYKRF